MLCLICSVTGVQLRDKHRTIRSLYDMGLRLSRPHRNQGHVQQSRAEGICLMQRVVVVDGCYCRMMSEND